MDETPAHVFSGGPYLNVALPEELQSFVPVNASSLVREWESLIDPIDAMRFVASAAAFKEDWLIGKWFTTLGWETLALLRKASKDESLIEVFGYRGNGDLRWETGASFGLRECVRGDGDSLDSSALPVLLGLAVFAALHYGIGQASFSLAKRLAAEEQNSE